MVRTFPTAPGIDGRPILASPLGVRHLAFRNRHEVFWTYCGRRVPDDHICPTEAELQSQKVWVMLNCEACHRQYRALYQAGDPVESAPVAEREKAAPAPKGDDRESFVREPVDLLAS
jgi:hypothetical protein